MRFKKRVSFTDRSVDSVNSFFRDIKSSNPITTEQEYELWLRMQQGSKTAREQLIYANLRYVVSVAKKYHNRKTLFEDLIQAGNEGLVKAVDKFDASLGCRLISYATWYIENEVRKVANDFYSHGAVSLDKPLYDEQGNSSTLLDTVASYPNQSTDWNLRYTDMLNDLKNRVEERQYGLGQLTVELHHMLCDGYTTSDFAHKHRLNETQMKRLLTILREEAKRPLRSAA